MSGWDCAWRPVVRAHVRVAGAIAVLMLLHAGTNGA